MIDVSDEVKAPEARRVEAAWLIQKGVRHEVVEATAEIPGPVMPLEVVARGDEVVVVQDRVFDHSGESLGGFCKPPSMRTVKAPVA